MMHDFPNGMGVGDRMGLRLLCGYVVNDFPQ
jgi:hypothetical protein